MTASPGKTAREGIAKYSTGIEGFDAIGGGLPANRTSLVLGEAGAGKTVFALQTLVNGARMFGEPGIFVAFEENSHQIAANAASFGWDLAELEREKLFFLDARMPSDTITIGSFDLSAMLGSLKAKAREMGAKRIVFDAVDVLLSLMQDPVKDRVELYRIHGWLAASSLSGIITARIGNRESNSPQTYDFLQFMADCIVRLNQDTDRPFSNRSVRILKYRGSGFIEKELPMLITRNGIEILTPVTEDQPHVASTERVSSGIERLDAMLNGGYLRGSSLLVTGSPGTAKSTISGVFVDASCKRGEPSLYISFDERPTEIVRNLRSVAIDLAPHLESGCLRMEYFRSGTRSGINHMIVIRDLIKEFHPQCMVIDPMSALILEKDLNFEVSPAKFLLDLCKDNGITLLMTSLLESTSGDVESTPLDISTIADTWVHLSYLVRGGERNRALTIVKSRGTRHSNQVRELILSDQGLTISDIFTAGGEVLMGTMRYQKEADFQQEDARRKAEGERRRRELKRIQAETRAQIEALQIELENSQAELESFNAEESGRQQYQADARDETFRRRGGNRASMEEESND